MSDSDNYDVMLVIPETEAKALAQFAKRVDYGTCARFASATVKYAGRCEADVMWSAICLLQRQLAEAGFAPR